MYIPTLHPRQISTNTDNNRQIAWVASIIIIAVVIIGVWCVFKIWGSRARNARAEQNLGVSAVSPPRSRSRKKGDVLPAYDPNGRPPAFSPPGMPPPAYLPTEGTRRPPLRRTPSLGSIEEKDEEVDEKKQTQRRGSV